MKIKLTVAGAVKVNKPITAQFKTPFHIGAIIKTLELFGTCRVTMHVDGKQEEMIFPDIGTEWAGDNPAKRKRHLVKSWIDKLILQTVTRGLYK